MIKATDARQQVKNYIEILRQQEREKAIQWCETEVNEIIEKKSNSGWCKAVVNSNKEISLALASDYLVENGYKVQVDYNKKIIIEW